MPLEVFMQSNKRGWIINKGYSDSVITTHNWCEADETKAVESGYRGTLR